MARKKIQRQPVQIVGKHFALTGFFARRVPLLGIEVPMAGIAIIVMLMLVGFTIWGILFSRAPRQITQSPWACCWAPRSSPATASTPW